MFFKDDLKFVADKLGICLDQIAIDKFYDYYLMIIEKNKVMNLTAITEESDVIRKHFADSISLLKYFKLSPGTKIIDVGTGAGFPGIPLKIVCPDIEVLLLDSLQKRLTFLNDVCDKLELVNVSTIHGRAEDLAHLADYREQYDYAVSRAVARLNVLSEYVLPFVKVGGSFVSYKSQKCEEELDEASGAIKKLGGSIDCVYDVFIDGLDEDRKLVNIVKNKSTPVLYPRISGKIKKEPLR